MTKKLRVLELFAGIGGFSLGLERTGGFETVAFCEIEEFPRKVLAKHWPEVPQYEDVRTLTKDILDRDGIAVDVITGGFPCQDISCAGRRAGIGEGTRSGLWSEIVRLIGELSPRYVIVENVANLLSGPSEQRGGWFGRILGDLAECGYDAEWENIPASALGAPHRRERVWVVAYRPQERAKNGLQSILQAAGEGELRRGSWRPWVFGVHNPPVCHVDDGVPDYMGGHYAAGNAVVPRIPEMIGRAILQVEND
jgi:DNA (cytosine-5)-methyltransferase 1